VTRDEIEAKVRETYDAWNRHDAAGVAQTYALDCVLRDNARETSGRDGIKGLAEDYLDAFPDLHIELVSLYVDGNTALQEWRTTGTHEGALLGIPATGRRSETIGAGVDVFGDDGLISRSALYWDTIKLLQDIGVLPAAEVATA
jgi:steroid delta-isomerase-like uncharacterized protein